MNSTSTTATVSVEALSIDSTVQRAEGVDDRRVEQIASNFAPAKLGTITVSRRANGALVVLDGAHRSAACRLVGHQKIRAVIHDGLTLAEEADLFVGLNTFKQPSAVSRFRAAVVAGNKAATDIKRIVEGHGWAISFDNRDGVITCVTALERVYKNCGGTKADGAHADALDWVMDVLTAAWEHENGSATAHHVLALAQIFGRFGASVDAKKLIHEMQQTRPGVVLGRARTLRESQGGTVPAALAKVLVGLHNKKRRTNLLPEWVWTR